LFASMLGSRDLQLHEEANKLGRYGVRALLRFAEAR